MLRVENIFVHDRKQPFFMKMNTIKTFFETILFSKSWSINYMFVFFHIYLPMKNQNIRCLVIEFSVCVDFTLIFVWSEGHLKVVKCLDSSLPVIEHGSHQHVKPSPFFCHNIKCPSFSTKTGPHNKCKSFWYSKCDILNNI